MDESGGRYWSEIPMAEVNVSEYLIDQRWVNVDLNHMAEAEVSRQNDY